MTASSIEAILALLLKATLLLTIAGALHVLMARRTSAASRHLVWTFVVVGLLALPVLSVVLPAWSVAVPVMDDARGSSPAGGQPGPVQPWPSAAPAPIGALEAGALPDLSVASGGPISPVGAEPAGGFDPLTMLVVLYLAGVLLLLARLTIVEHLRVRRVERASEPVQELEWRQLLNGLKEAMGVEQPVVLLRRGGGVMPMTWGTLHPRILIPADADSWAEDRRRAVLLHELAHVARRDCLTQWLAGLACALYWFHPGVWWTERKLRMERELACDDRVLAAGTRATEYARHLLEVAHRFRAPHLVTAVAMARPSQLEARILAALDHGRARMGPGKHAIVLCAVLSTLVLLPLAALRADAAPVAAAVPGADPHGAAEAAALETGIRYMAANGNSSAGIARTDQELEVPDGAVPASAPALPGGEWSIRLAEPGEAPATGPIAHVALWAPGLNTFYIPLNRLEGLTAGQIASDGAPVRFAMRRDAGTFSFQGTFRAGRGTGRFDFAPDPVFAAALVARGMARPTPEQQLSLARHDVGIALLDELAAQGYVQPTTEMLVRVGRTGVDLRYVREMGVVGYRLGTVQELVRLSNQSIGPALVRELAAAGYTALSPADLVRMRRSGLSADSIRRINERAGRTLTPDELVELRTRRETRGSRERPAISSTSTPLEGRWVIHQARGASVDLELFWTDDTNWRRWRPMVALRGMNAGAISSPGPTPVSFRIEQDAGTFEFEGSFRNGRGTGEFHFRPNRQFAATLRALGVDGAGSVTDHQLKNFAYGHVSAAEVRQFLSLGLWPLTLDEALRLTIHQATPDYVREMQAAGVSDANSVAGVVDMRIQGVTTEYARELAELGYGGLSGRELIRMWRGRVTPAFVRSVRDAGYRDVPPEVLITMRRRGIEDTARGEGLRREG
jgi:beta-lactamase regulating signal transducer with metallopeptidase domain